MIGKDEQREESDSNVDPIKLITNKRKLLEDNVAQVQEEIRNCFTQLVQALQFRERQLLRQADAVHTQQLSLVQSSLESLPPSIVNFDGKDQLEKHIREFGRIELSGTNCLTVKDAEPYKVADYQEANKDHVSFDKSIKHEDAEIEDKRTEILQINRQDQVGDPENVISNCSSLFNSSLCSSSPTNINLRQKVSKLDKTSVQLNDSQELPSCSPLLVIKQKLSLTRLASDGLQDIDTKCSDDSRSGTETSVVDTVKDDAIKREENTEDTVQTEECNKANAYIETNFCEREGYVRRGDTSNRTPAKDNLVSQETLKDAYEHPKQVQQWLQQILVETEIEPMIHEIGQFSQISEAHQFQLET